MRPIDSFYTISVMPRLQGQRALITGGTSGIGLETARRFLEEGARVAITGLSKAGLDAARKELGDVIVIEADAGDAADQGKVAEQIRKAFGQLDVLFINVGIADLKPLGQWDTAAFDRSFNTNVKGPYFLLQELLPVFANPASIVINGSVNPHIGMPTSSVYAATKSAMISLTKTLSGELISRGIRVNAVSAGPIMTRFMPGGPRRSGLLSLSRFPLEGSDSQVRSRMLSCFSLRMRPRLRSAQSC